MSYILPFVKKKMMHPQKNVYMLCFPAVATTHIRGRIILILWIHVHKFMITITSDTLETPYTLYDIPLAIRSGSVHGNPG